LHSGARFAQGAALPDAGAVQIKPSVLTDRQYE